MVFDWLILRIPGWSRKVRRLRRDWDRRREKALTKKGRVKKFLLEKLDKIENRLRIIEEQPLQRRSRGRIAKEIEIDLAEVKIILKMKDEEIAAEFKKMQPVQKKSELPKYKSSY